jgi:hypothetical protein
LLCLILEQPLKNTLSMHQISAKTRAFARIITRRRHASSSLPFWELKIWIFPMLRTEKSGLAGATARFNVDKVN